MRNCPLSSLGSAARRCSVFQLLLSPESREWGEERNTHTYPPRGTEKVSLPSEVSRTWDLGSVCEMHRCHVSNRDGRGDDGMYPRSSDGLQGHVLGTGAAGAGTDTRYQAAIEAVSPSDVPCAGPTVTAVVFPFLSDFLLFPDLIGASAFYLLCFQGTSRSSFLELSHRPRNSSVQQTSYSASSFLLNQ